MRVEAQNISKTFGEVQALKDLSFVIEKGKALGLLGRNGAGKTTAIRILLGILPSDTGKVLVDNKKLSFDENAFGYLPEERGLYLKYTVKSQLMHFASLYGMKKKEALNSIEYWLEKFEISEYLNKKVETLSKGNKQKIQLIVAVMHDPEVIILDEPFSGLDPVNVELFKTVIRELLAKGKTLIFSSHRMADVEEFCDDIIMLKKGETILQGDLDKIKEDYGIKGLVVEGEEKVQDFLKELGFEALEFKKGSYRVNLKDLEKGKELLRKITNTDLDIRGFYFERPSLNDIFIERLGD
ncbi:ATP-binding cassette domain-containing protein [Clostridium perfringens]|uniref:ATP-binding cassette domain-containing protein n=1 Tax=Clostridium perfringens TaxID=1502 RepID=UPI001ABB9482|nr:ATP-binding cassette domain-containing protein [Clostridium perfringens]EJT6500959.1 ATP-binding cassette domain-containing protein [Clostridium perfringens]ELC8347688.1 ATP-binding cassette domain-containing protein [Clostridium perfringens]ELC8439250.1 ATP-binding cassette domain-containing protein [Clostridium perfringens]MBO3366910.1 ATP-binding cassette domain-containing protein [Clostridium perfringens]